MLRGIDGAVDCLLARHRVVSDGKVVGVFTERDLLNRVVAKGLDAAVSNAMAKANTDLFVELQENEGTISISFAQTWAKLIASPICGKPPGGRGLRAPQATPGTVLR